MRDCIFKSTDFHVSKKAISQGYFNIARFARLIFSKLFYLKTWNSLKLNLGFPSCWGSFLYLLIFFSTFYSLNVFIFISHQVGMNLLEYRTTLWLQYIYTNTQFFEKKNQTSFKNNFAYYWVIWSWIIINLN